MSESKLVDSLDEFVKNPDSYIYNTPSLEKGPFIQAYTIFAHNLGDALDSVRREESEGRLCDLRKEGSMWTLIVVYPRKDHD